MINSQIQESTQLISASFLMAAVNDGSTSLSGFSRFRFSFACSIMGGKLSTVSEWKQDAPTLRENMHVYGDFCFFQLLPSLFDQLVLAQTKCSTVTLAFLRQLSNEIEIAARKLVLRVLILFCIQTLSANKNMSELFVSNNVVCIRIFPSNYQIIVHESQTYIVSQVFDRVRKQS